MREWFQSVTGASTVSEILIILSLVVIGAIALVIMAINIAASDRRSVARSARALNTPANWRIYEQADNGTIFHGMCYGTQHEALEVASKVGLVEWVDEACHVIRIAKTAPDMFVWGLYAEGGGHFKTEAMSRKSAIDQAAKLGAVRYIDEVNHFIFYRPGSLQ